MLLDTHGGTAWGQVLRDVAHPPPAARLRDGLQTIEKVLVLEEMPVFSRASSDQLAALAGITREVKMTEGEVLFGAGDAPAIHIVLEGELSLEPMNGGTPMSAGAGDCTGVYETLGGLDQTGWRGHVTRGGVALAGRPRGVVRSAGRPDRPVARPLQRAAAAARGAGSHGKPSTS